MSFSKSILTKREHIIEKAAFSSSVNEISIVRNSTLQPISEEKDGGGFKRTQFQLVL